MAGPYAYPTGWYRPRTPEGLKYTTFALVLAAGGSVLGGLVALSLPEMVGPYPGIGRFTGLCAGAIFGFVAVILFLAGFHAVCASMFDLAAGYSREGMSAYVKLQEHEFALEEQGYTATRHQREVGAGYFDAVLEAITGGESSTLALKGSTEEAQFVAVAVT